MLRCLSACLLLLALCAGCSETPRVADEPFEGWPAMQKLGTDTIMIVGMDASMGNWAAVKKGASSSEFEKGISEFASSEVPPQIGDVKPLKEETAAGFQKLIDAAKNGDNKAIEEAWKEAKASYDKLTAAVNKAKSSS